MSLLTLSSGTLRCVVPEPWPGRRARTVTASVGSRLNRVQLLDHCPNHHTPNVHLADPQAQASLAHRGLGRRRSWPTRSGLSRSCR